MSSSTFLRMLAVGLLSAAVAMAEEAPVSNADHLSPIAWTSAQWQSRCEGVRTSYNPEVNLSDERLTIVPGDVRWLDFVFWSLNNKVAEHQVEQYGGTEWNGPQGGVVFHWAPGSHWERDTLASFGFTIGHVIGEHRWLDTMFPDFFEKYGGVYGINVKDRLTEIDPGSAGPWVEFLEHIGGATSPYYRYLFHQEAVVDADRSLIHLLGGQGVAFSYTYERYYHELREVLTDCRAIDFFEMYDRFGHGFASSGNWARQNPPPGAAAQVGYVASAPPVTAKRYEPDPPAVEVPEQLPNAAAMERGKAIYLGQCAVCHGVQGDGRGLMAAGFDVRPRDFTTGQYKFRSTRGGELPLLSDVGRIVKEGVPGTTMPAWGQFLSDDQIRDVSNYLVVFSDRFRKTVTKGESPVLAKLTEKPSDYASLVDDGREVYGEMGCASCHGDRGRGDGDSAEGLEDDWGFSIPVADLTNKWAFRGGHEPEDVYRTLITGLNGTPMPAYGDAFRDDRSAWALTAYVLSLSPSPRPVLHLEEFPSSRGSRIGADGRVLAAP